MENVFSVSALNEYIHEVFLRDENIHNISICGEVSGIRVVNKHAYFNLKDENAAIQCSCFNYAKTHLPKEGERIIATGNVDYYAANGKLSIIVSTIKPDGVGALAVELEKLKNRLKLEGIFDPAHKKSIPNYCKRVCVLTSKSGAVIRDIISTTRKYNSIIDIAVMDVRVQGVGADLDIVNALKLVDQYNFDAIIIARGGGSFEDLMPFNSEILIRTIYDTKTPIISAVGHETDTTLCDYVADARALTPTAGAELIAYDEKELKQYFIDSQQKLLRELNHILEFNINKFNILINRLNGAFNINYSNNSHKLEKLLTKICEIAKNSLDKKEYQLHELAVKLDAFNPAKIFSKGFLFVEKNGESIKYISDLKTGDSIKLKGIDGQATAEILEVKK